MQYRRFGKTGLQMPVYSAGCMRSMQSWNDINQESIDNKEQERQLAILERAIAHGINHIETARGYGSSERQLGAILPHFKRQDLIIQTKVVPADDPKVFAGNVEDSLDRMQLDFVDLFAFHGINDFHSLWQVCRPGGCLSAARRLQQQGKLRWIGFSGHGFSEVIRDAICHERDGGFDYINIHWYTIFQKHTEVLQEAKARDLGVFIISPSDKGGMLYQPNEKIAALSKPLTPMQFNDLYCLQRPEIHTLSIGASRPGDYAEHVQALEYLEDSALLQGIYAGWQDAMELATGQRHPGDHWPLFPAYDKTPGYMNIPFILWLDNLVRGWDLQEFARARYGMLSQGSAWVSGNNGAHASSFDLTEIAKKAGMTTENLVTRLEDAHDRLQKPL